MARRKVPVIPDALLDQLLSGADARTEFDQDGLLDQLKKAFAERALKAEMDHHLTGAEPGNRRNGYGKKTILTDTGSMEVSIPRDRAGTFDPQLIGKYQRHFPGFDQKIISMYGRGMSGREIADHLRELYGIEVSPDLISAVTDAVIEEVTAWQNRLLEAIYADLPPNDPRHQFLTHFRIIADPELVGFGKNANIRKSFAAINAGGLGRWWHPRDPSLRCELALRQPSGFHG